MFKKILYPTDFSDASKKALDYIKQLKQAGIKEVIVLHVIDEREIDAVFQHSAVRFEDIVRSIKADAKKEMDAGPMGTYTTFQQDGKDVAGMMNPTGPIDAPRWSAHIAVDNIDECALKVENLGGKILVKPHDIPDTGRVCMISDPVGAIICLIQPILKK